LKLSNNKISRIEQSIKARLKNSQKSFLANKEVSFIKNHIKSLPEIYSKDEISQIKKELSTIKVLDDFEYASRRLQDLLPQLTVLDLGQNNLHINELLSNIHKNVDWISELDFRGNKNSSEANKIIRSHFPFLEVLNGEIVTEVGYSTKCKIKSLGGEWKEGEEMMEIKEIEIDEEKKEVLDYFESFEKNLKTQRTMVDSMFDIFDKKKEKIDEIGDDRKEEIQQIVEKSKKAFEEVALKSKEIVPDKQVHSTTSILGLEEWKQREKEKMEKKETVIRDDICEKCESIKNENSENLTPENIKKNFRIPRKKPAKKENPKKCKKCGIDNSDKRTQTNPPSNSSTFSFSKKSKFKFFNVANRLYSKNTKSMLKTQNEQIRQMLNSNK
jgi:hypothetical protein